MTVNAYPLSWPDGWPRSTVRKTAKFGKRTTDPGRTWQNLGRLTVAQADLRVRQELAALGVRDGDAVVSANLVLRLDGRPRSDQNKPDDPGVAVYWQAKHGEPMRVMAIDIYDRVEDNLAAIAATLSAMRAIARHGGARILERAFTGFVALPPPNDDWWTKVLGLENEPAPIAESAVMSAYRRRLKDLHPDHGGSGTSEQIERLQAARDLALRRLNS